MRPGQRVCIVRAPPGGRLPPLPGRRDTGTGCVGAAAVGGGIHLLTMAAPVLSPDCLGWARAAGYGCSTEDSTETLVLRSKMGPPTRYHIRQVRDRLRMTTQTEERPMLFAADREVLERFLYGVFGDDIRDE